MYNYVMVLLYAWIYCTCVHSRVSEYVHVWNTCCDGSWDYFFLCVCFCVPISPSSHSPVFFLCALACICVVFLHQNSFPSLDTGSLQCFFAFQFLVDALEQKEICSRPMEFSLEHISRQMDGLFGMELGDLSNLFKVTQVSSLQVFCRFLACCSPSSLNNCMCFCL